jgi:hypothetical protein
VAAERTVRPRALSSSSSRLAFNAFARRFDYPESCVVNRGDPQSLPSRRSDPEAPLVRRPFLVPELARAYADPASSEARREAIAVAFESFHRYLGIGIGECLGYLLTGAWTMLVGVAMLQSSAFAAWLAWPGIIIGLCLIVGSLEFVGRFEEQGWKLAGAIVPIAYIAWSLWLVLSGLVFLVE